MTKPTWPSYRPPPTSRKLDLQSLDQLETRITRRFERALRTYNEIRAQFPPPSDSDNELQNEPETDSPEAPPQRESLCEIAKSENEPNNRIHAIDLPRVSEAQPTESSPT